MSATWFEKLKEIREKKGLSQDALSRLSGITKDHISKMELGKQTNPRLGTVMALTEALGVEMAALFAKSGHGKGRH